MKKFFERVKAALVKLFGSTTWEKTTSATIAYIAPLLETIVGLAAGGPAETIVTAIVAKIQSALATVTAVVDGATTTPPANEIAAVTEALNSIKTNLAALLADADVKNSGLLTKVTAVVDTIIGEVEAILAEIPSSSTGTASSGATA
jgi:hypothetical protein